MGGRSPKGAGRKLRAKAPQKPRSGAGSPMSRRSPWAMRLRRTAIAVALTTLGLAGFYLASLYAQISAILEQRHAALSSAVYSAPHRIRPGDDLDHSQLVDRLTSLSYSPVSVVTTPGEYARTASSLILYLRGFRRGSEEIAPKKIVVTLKGGDILALRDAAGAALAEALLEPETIGCLVPGAPVENVEVDLVDQKPWLVQGLLATEDRFFYWHPGINPLRIVAAAITDLREGRLAAGASTLTQQLARTFLGRRDRSFERKFKELAVALLLEYRLTKDEILERYINDVSMGAFEGTPIQGMPQAARYFFHKDLVQVTPAEAATLIGMVQGPTIFDPRRHPEASTKRRDVVLGAMKSQGVIDAATYAEAIAEPVRVSKAAGLRRAPYFTDHVISQLAEAAGIRGDLTGLKVYTTLDAAMQSDTTRAVRTNLENLEKNHKDLRRATMSAKLQGSAVVLDARSGAIRALVGGRDYSHSQFNRAASALRQPGSVFKPVVYMAALDPDRAPFRPVLTLASLLPDQPMSFRGWTPANYEHTYEGKVTTAKALFESLNVPTAYIGNRLGPDLIVHTAHELGIRQDLPKVLPISIGAGETTLLDMTSVYQVFAAGGTHSPPWAIEVVADDDGRELYRHKPRRNRVTSAPVAYLLTGALQAVLRYGTGAGAGRLGLDIPAAGKTGTTQDYKDAYFVGYTPDIVCGVWVGFDSPQSLGLTGAQAALPAWVQILQDSAPAVPSEFSRPAGIVMAGIDPESGGLATSSCRRSVSLPFLTGTAPMELCRLHDGAMEELGATGSRIWGGAASSKPEQQPSDRTPSGAGNVMNKVGKFFGGLFRR